MPRRNYYQANREKLLADSARWHQENPEYHRAYLKQYTRRPGERRKTYARNTLYRAVRDGLIKRLPCQAPDCGQEPAEGHHVNYDRPLDVRWLCKQHHEDAHHQTTNERGELCNNQRKDQPMRHVSWLVPTKRKGERLVPVTLKLSQPFLLALKEYAAAESRKPREDQDGRVYTQRVSQGTILTTLALEADARLRRLYQRHQ